MWRFGADFSLTPTVGDPNITLEAAANLFAQILEWGFGGEVTASTLMRTGVHRAVEGVGSRTAVTPGIFVEGSTAAGLFASSAFNTTQPAVEGGSLWSRAWNAHGGVIRWLAAPGEEPTLLGVSSIVLENSVGTALSNYGFIWGEY